MAFRFHFLVSVVLLAGVTEAVVAAEHTEIIASAHVSMGITEKVSTPLQVSALADVTVSDGLTYQVRTSHQARQIAIFHRDYPDRSVTLGVDGKGVWMIDKGALQDVGPRNAMFVHGHQFHARLIGFGHLFTDYKVLDEDDLPPDCACKGISANAGQGELLTMYFGEDSNLPKSMVSRYEDGPVVVQVFSDWETVGGVLLPRKIEIDDGSRTFRYDFGSIDLNADGHEAMRPAFDDLNDGQKLRRLHRIAMEAHLFGDYSEMSARVADTYTSVNRGEINEIDRQAFADRFKWIFSTRKYLDYVDLVQPVVKVSEDGTLGWVIVQVSAEGVLYGTEGRDDQPFTFVSGWIELYEKIDGEWRMTGNVSNFKTEG